MKPWWWRGLLVFSFVALAVLAMAQGKGGAQQNPVPESKPDEVRLPSGKLQRDEILKAEHAQNVKDAAQLSELAQQLQQDLEKEDRFVLSISTLKKTEDIEKLARKIRTRLRHN